jgi:hypothetical protein
VPVNSFTVGAVYNREFGDVDMRVRMDYAYTGHSYGSYETVNPVGQPNLNFYNPAYGVLNGSISLSRGRYVFTLYAKNLLNNQTLIQTPEVNTVYQGYTVHPRVIGASLNAHF